MTRFTVQNVMYSLPEMYLISLGVNVVGLC